MWRVSFLQGERDSSTAAKPSLVPPVNLVPLFSQDDEVVLQCSATVLKEQLKLCLAAEGFGNRLCFLEPTSNAQVCVHQRRRRGRSGGQGFES